MRKYLFSVAAITLAACSQSSNKTTTTPNAPEPAAYDTATQYAKFAQVDMAPDTSFLSESERAVVNKLIEASGYLSEIYLRQLDVRNPDIRADIAASDRADKDLLLGMFDLHFGVCDGLENYHVFYGDTPCP